MTATPQGTPQLTIPEGQEGIASPDQQELVEQIQQEGQISEEAQQVLEKFKSTEDLAKSYAELQRKFTQNQQQKPETQTETETTEKTPDFDPEKVNWPESIEEYTVEIGEKFYGKEVAQALSAAEVNPVEMCEKFYAGEDVSSYVNDIVEKGGIPRGLVERYLEGSRQAAGFGSTTTSEGMTEEQEQQIKDELGGDAAFNQIADWAGKNLNAETLKAYNETIDSGNPDAIRWAVRSLQIEMANPNAVVEPKLIGGGDVPSQTTFTSQQQVLDALGKTNDKGQKIYDLDGTYRDSVKEMLARSGAWDSLK